MSGEVLINLTPMETRVAVVENGVLQEAFIAVSYTHLTLPTTPYV